MFLWTFCPHHPTASSPGLLMAGWLIWGHWFLLLWGRSRGSEKQEGEVGETYRGQRGACVLVWVCMGGWTHRVFSVVPLCSSFLLIFNVRRGGKSHWLQYGCVKPTPLGSFSPLGGDWRFTECPHVISCPAAAASTPGGARGGKVGREAKWKEASIHASIAWFFIRSMQMLQCTC